MSRKYVTLKDISKKTGLAVTTVSKALRNHPDINKKTARMVQKAAEKMGYIKNVTASQLKRNKSNTVGVVLSDSSNPFFAEFMAGLESEAFKQGYKLIRMNSEGEQTKEEEAIKTLLQYRVDGLVIFPLQESIHKYEKYGITRNGVLIGWSKEEGIIDSVYTEEYKGMYLATTHLIKTGRKEILFLDNFLYKTGYYGRRFEGYKQAVIDHGLVYKEENHIINTNLEKQHRIYEGYTSIKNVIESGKKFDGLVCFNDLLAYGAIKALHEMKVKIPDDVGVVGYDSLTFSMMVYPSLSSVNYSKFHWGELALRTLLKRLKNPDMPIQEIVIDVELEVRESSLKQEYTTKEQR
ncbi:MAG: LacI family DNA-binding transcriptional regulator [Thermotogota bacterium]|nr:LacI family DNA-binding transcriptional regulator [Thermotogota bacterium]